MVYEQIVSWLNSIERENGSDSLWIFEDWLEDHGFHRKSYWIVKSNFTPDITREPFYLFLPSKFILKKYIDKEKIYDNPNFTLFYYPTENHGWADLIFSEGWKYLEKYQDDMKGFLSEYDS